jgi:hypothetical protein
MTDKPKNVKELIEHLQEFHHPDTEFVTNGDEPLSFQLCAKKCIAVKMVPDPYNLGLWTIPYVGHNPAEVREFLIF